MMPGGHQDKVMKTGHLGISGALATGLKLVEITTCNVEKGIYIDLPIKNYYLTLQFSTTSWSHEFIRAKSGYSSAIHS